LVQRIALRQPNDVALFEVDRGNNQHLRERREVLQQLETQGLTLLGVKLAGEEILAPQHRGKSEADSVVAAITLASPGCT
jgi:hypothetical protein